MQHISSLADIIKNEFTVYTFALSDEFKWSPNSKTIHHPSLTTYEDIWSLLHEIAHAELGHFDYTLDVQLINHEAEAWKHAIAVLAPHYSLTISRDYVEDHLDTYRLWLHKRSICPDCGHNGLQTKNTYSCINCRCVWRANEARLCTLRRITLQGRDQIS